MNRLQAMAQIMMLLNRNGLLKPGNPVYKHVRKMAAGIIDRLGPDEALAYVRQNHTEFLDRIRILGMWHNATGKKPSPTSR